MKGILGKCLSTLPPSPAGELFAVNCCSNCWDQFERRELDLISLLLQCVQNQLNSPVISLLSTSPCNVDAQRSGNSRQRALGSLDSPAKLPFHIPDPLTSTEEGGRDCGVWVVNVSLHQVSRKWTKKQQRGSSSMLSAHPRSDGRGHY